MTIAPSTVAEIVAPGRSMWLPEARRIEAALDVTGEVVTTRSCDTRDAIPMPDQGEAIMLHGSPHHFLGWVDLSGVELVGLVCGAGYVATQITMPPESWDARSIVIPGASRLDESVLFGIVRGLWSDHTTSERLTAERLAGRAEAQQAAEKRLTDIVESAHEWADLHELCDRFDEFCRDHNLPERESEWEITARLTIEVPVRVTVSGPSRESAAYDVFRDKFDEDDVWNLIRTGEIEMSTVTAYEVDTRYAEQVD